MDRREALSRVAILMGGMVIGANVFLETGCRSTPKEVGTLFSQDHIDLLNEICETILPATPASPGAKAAKTGEFLAVMVKDCYGPEDQRIFIDGIGKVNIACQKKYNKGFMECSPEQRSAVLISLDAERKSYEENRKPDDPNHYFRMVKELTLLGFFTSEIGATKALRYIAVPGKYVGVVPYKKGDKGWCTFDYFN